MVMITMINDFWIDSTGESIGCYKLMSVENGYGNLVNFVVDTNYLLCRPCNGYTRRYGNWIL